MFQTIIDDSDRNVKAVYTRNNLPPYEEGTFESHYFCEFKFAIKRCLTGSPGARNL